MVNAQGVVSGAVVMTFLEKRVTGKRFENAPPHP